MSRIFPDISHAALVELGTSHAGPLFLHMTKLAVKVDAKAKINASGPVVGVRTGNLRSSIHNGVEVRGTDLVGVIRCDAAYAVAVHEGTKPHDIKPVRAMILAWKGPAGPVFTRSVHHPGARGRPFLADALPAIND